MDESVKIEVDEKKNKEKIEVDEKKKKKEMPQKDEEAGLKRKRTTDSSSFERNKKKKKMIGDNGKADGNGCSRYSNEFNQVYGHKIGSSSTHVPSSKSSSKSSSSSSKQQDKGKGKEVAPENYDELFNSLSIPNRRARTINYVPHHFTYVFTYDRSFFNGFSNYEAKCPENARHLNHKHRINFSYQNNDARIFTAHSMWYHQNSPANMQAEAVTGTSTSSQNAASCSTASQNVGDRYPRVELEPSLRKRLNWSLINLQNPERNPIMVNYVWGRHGEQPVFSLHDYFDTLDKFYRSSVINLGLNKWFQQWVAKQVRTTELCY